MADLWQEIERLKRIVSDLEARVAKQSAILEKHPRLRVGDVLEVTGEDGQRLYRMVERSVAEQSDDEFVEVKLMAGDPGPAAYQQPHAFLMDKDGQRFILPNPHRIILVEDQGNGTGQHVEKDTDGSISTPENSETLDMLVAEPDTQFHDGEYAFAAGRIYPAMKIVSIDGTTSKYLVFLEGFGDDDKEWDLSVTAVEDETFTLRITTDYAGKVKNFEVVE